MKKKKDTTEWLKEMTLKEFRDVFVEWYLPALKTIAYDVKQLGEKMDEINEKLSTTLAINKEKK